MRAYSEVENDESTERPDKGQGRKQLRHYSVGQTTLSIIAIVTGTISIILMANNRAFPAFTLSPVSVGLLGLTTGILGLTMSKKVTGKSMKQDNKNRNIMFIHYLLNVLAATLACIGMVYSCICGALCSGMRMYTSQGTSDAIQFCQPITTLSSVFAFVNGGVCFIVGIWTMRGVCFSCSYGSSCGLNAAAV